MRFQRTSATAYAEALERRLADLEEILRRLKLRKAEKEAIGNEPKELLPGVSASLAREFVTKVVHFYSDDPTDVIGRHQKTEPERVVDMSFTLSEILFSEPTRTRVPNGRRAEFWRAPPWEHSIITDRATAYTFPEDDLLISCTNLFFENFNIFIPLLHRPSFTRGIQSKQHLKDDKFGGVVLLVCALGSRFSDDPRALSEGETSPLSNGWKWFNQIDVAHKVWLSPPCLYDLQTICLFIFFMHTCSTPILSWTLMGAGIRLAQNLGVRHGYPLKAEEPPTVESELWKRAWWALIVVDRVMSSSMGRPCAVHFEALHVPLPIDCDDEYWEMENPEQAFRQPAGKPSTVSCFIHFIKLMNLTALTLGSLYKPKLLKVMPIRGAHYDDLFLNALNSALNKWKENIPKHLQWNPDQTTSPIFFDQSFMLLVNYYHLQILIHRPFIPSPASPQSPLSAPSLAICTNAARGCCNTARIYDERRKHCIPFVQAPVFVSVVILLLVMWLGKDQVSNMTYVHDFLRTLEQNEKRSSSAGQLRDILLALIEAKAEGPEPYPMDAVPPGLTTIPNELGWSEDDPLFLQLQALLDQSSWNEEQAYPDIDFFSF